MQSNIVQSYLGQKATKYLSEKYNTELFIEKIEIRFFFDVELKGVYIADDHKNTLLKADRIHINLDDFDFNTNYFNLDELRLEKTTFNLRRYKNDEKLNIGNFISLFGSDTTTTSKKYDYPIKIRIGKLRVINSSFSFISDNMEHNKNQVVDFNDVGLTNLDIDMDDVAIIGDSVAADIKNLTIWEKRGFKLNEFSGKAIVSSKNIIVDNLLIKTPNSNLDLDLKFNYTSFDDFDDFINKVKIKSEIRKTALNMIDISYFTSEMTGMSNKIIFSSNSVKGTVSDLKVNKFKFQYRHHTILDADITMVGLPKIEETFINLNIRRLSSSVDDINQIILPASEGKTTRPVMPDILKRLGNVVVRGKFTGFYSNFVAYGSVKTDIGSVATDVIVSNAKGKISYNGKVVTKELDLGTFIQSTDIVGKMSIDAQISGSGLDAKTASFKVNGLVNMFEFNHYSYSGIVINGGLDQMMYTGEVNINDKNLKLDFNGTVDFSDSIPDYNFISNITHADLAKLNFLPKDSVSELSGILRMNFSGKSIDGLEGSIYIDRAKFIRNDRFLSLNSLALQTFTKNTGYRTIDIKSDYVDAGIKGFFVLKDLPVSFEQFVSYYLPNIDLNLDSNNNTITRQEFDFDIKLYNVNPVFDFLITGIKLSKNSSITGNFNSINHTSVIIATSSEINILDKRLIDCKINFEADSKNIHLDLLADTLKISDSAWMANFNFNTTEINDSLISKITWDNHGYRNKNSGELNLYTYFYPDNRTLIGFRTSALTLNDSVWHINPNGTVTFDSTSIKFQYVTLSNNLQEIFINGSISKIPSDTIEVEFSKFNASNFDFVTNTMDFDLDGIITGKFFASNLYGVPSYYADVKIRDFGFNHDKLGDAIIFSKWDPIKKGLKINTEINYTGAIGISRPLNVTGYYYPTHKTQNFDLDIELDNFRLKSVSRYIESFGSILNGTAMGKIKLTGTNKSPELHGNLRLIRTFVHIDYLNTTYSLSYDSVKITKNDFSFKNVVLIDQPYNDTAIMDGRIYHKNFKDLQFDFNIRPKKLLCMNTTSVQNELFYGKAFATGLAKIYGTPENLSMDIAARTERGTQLFIPIGGTSDFSQVDYVTFVKKHLDTANIDDEGRLIKGINMDMLFNVTDDAEITMMLDPKTGDRIRAKGNGNIRIILTPDYDFNLFGDYTITSGDYIFTFQKIINKKFIIDEGSTIKWNGDPYEAILDITARYRLKANLGSLGVQSSDSNRTVQVECIIQMSNVLSSPEFKFEVDFPSMASFEKDTYVAAVNMNLNNNFITLLLLNSFYASGSGINNSGGNSNFLGNSASEVLSNQLSNWLSQISKKVDIGFYYRPGQDLSQEEVSVALSTQFLNDKLLVESNFGVTNDINPNNTNTNQIVGDVNVEYKVNQKVKLRVFNRTNEYNAYAYKSPYTQGVGVVFSREFNKPRELFIKKDKTKVK